MISDVFIYRRLMNNMEMREEVDMVLLVASGNEICQTSVN